MAKIKGVMMLTVNRDEYISVWEGRAKDCDRGFAVLLDHSYQYVLYQDGQLIEVNTAGCPKIYPFSKNPQKKPGFFAKRTCDYAKIVCVSSDFSHCLHWGMRNSAVMFDPETKQPFTVGMSGSIYFTIGETPDDIIRFLRFTGFASDGDVKEKIRHIMQSAMQSLLSEFQYTLKQFQNIPLNEILKLSEVCYRKVNDMFIPYGIQLQPMTKSSLIEHVIANT
jgi:hypothetical protein